MLESGSACAQSRGPKGVGGYVKAAPEVNLEEALERIVWWSAAYALRGETGDEVRQAIPFKLTDERTYDTTGEAETRSSRGNR